MEDSEQEINENVLSRKKRCYLGIYIYFNMLICYNLDAKCDLSFALSVYTELYPNEKPASSRWLFLSLFLSFAFISALK